MIIKVNSTLITLNSNYILLLMASSYQFDINAYSIEAAILMCSSTQTHQI